MIKKSWLSRIFQSGIVGLMFFTVFLYQTPAAMSYVNLPPVLTYVPNLPVDPVTGSIHLNFDETLTITVTATDPNPGDNLTLSAGFYSPAPPMPDGASFTQTGPNTGIFEWTPTIGQNYGGGYRLQLRVDDDGSPPRFDFEDASIYVGIFGNNHPPDPPIVTGNLNVNVGDTLQLTITAADPDPGDTVSLSINNLPPFASFSWTPGNPATGLLEGIPTTDDIGKWNVRFSSEDDGSPRLSSCTPVVISVSDGECPQGMTKVTIVTPGGEVIEACVPDDVAEDGNIGGGMFIPATCPGFSQDEVAAAFAAYSNMECTRKDGHTQITQEPCTMISCRDPIYSPVYLLIALEGPEDVDNEGKCDFDPGTTKRNNLVVNVLTDYVDWWITEEEADACVAILNTFVP